MIYDDEILFDPCLTGDTDSIFIEQFLFFNLLFWYLEIDSTEKEFANRLPKFDNGSGLKGRPINACLSYMELFYQYEYIITDYKGTYHGFTYTQFKELDLDDIAKRQSEIIENIIVQIHDSVECISAKNTSPLPTEFHRYYTFPQIKKLEAFEHDPLVLFNLIQLEQVKAKIPNIFSSILRILVNPALNTDFILLLHNLLFDEYDHFFMNDDIDYINYFNPGTEYIDVFRILDMDLAHQLFKQMSSAFIKLDLINDMIYQFRSENVYSPYTFEENTSNAVRKYGPLIQEQYHIHDRYHLSRMIHCLCIKDISISSEVNIKRHNFDTILRLTHRFQEYF